jgi:thioredoxin reductase (NADPH)
MSDYLIGELDRYGVVVRDSSEVAALHGTDGRLESITLRDGERLPMSFLFLFLGATPCTDWLGASVLRDPDGFILSGSDDHGRELLETSIPGIYAAGDVRAGSLKRTATAVGEGAMVVSLVHHRLARTAA